jgi:hypothetical protein
MAIVGDGLLAGAAMYLLVTQENLLLFRCRGAGAVHAMVAQWRSGAKRAGGLERI